MKRKKLLAFGMLLMVAVGAKAIPAKPVTQTFKLADGSTVELTLRGDEHFSFYTDQNGAPCLLRQDGTLEHITMEQVRSTWLAQRQARMVQTSASEKATGAHGAPNRIGTPSATTGKHRGLVILMEFTDEKFVTPNPQSLYHRFFNEVGFNETGMSGSVRDYFLSQSYGQLEVDFDVVGPYTTKYQMSYYGGNDVTGNDMHPAQMVLEAVDAASAEVDFSNYDWDDDGEVDQVFVIYAGYAESSGASSNTIWPHEWTLKAGTGTSCTYNGKVIDTYGCASELKGNGKTNTGIIEGIGSACHEYSHCLGLPDMYDVQQGVNFAMSYWDVMCAGNYNDDSRTPAGFTAYERMFAGWLQPTEINSQTSINGMKPLATDPEAYILYNDNNRNEYYLLENRQPVEFDRGLPGHGLLVVHVDYNEAAWKANSINVDANHQRMTIIAADNTYQNSQASLAGDPFPGTKGNTSLTNYTTPAATLFNANMDGTKLMSKPIENITEDTQAHTVSFLACRPELTIPMPDDGVEQEGEGAFTITWPAVSGATSYEVEVTEMGAAASDPSEALQREFDFAAFQSASTGYTDISTNMAQYGYTGWAGSKLFTTPNKLRIGTSSSTGYLRTATWQVPPSSDMTVVIGAAPVKEGTPVTGTLQLAYANSGETVTTEDASMEVSDDGLFVFHFNARKDLFRLDIKPNAQMYMKYLAIYDGTWTAEQLGLDSSASAPRRASQAQVYTTETNSYTLSGLNPQSRYAYRVRAIGEANWYSQWSEEKIFVFGSTGVDVPTWDAHAPVRYYDLQGREVDATTKGLVIVKQGSTVRKVFK